MVELFPFGSCLSRWGFMDGMQMSRKVFRGKQAESFQYYDLPVM